MTNKLARRVVMAVVGFGLLAGTGIALADPLNDTFTATIKEIDPRTGVITLDDNSKLTVDEKVLVGKPVVGAVVVIEYTATENGYEPLKEVRVVDPKAPKSRVN